MGNLFSKDRCGFANCKRRTLGEHYFTCNLHLCSKEKCKLPRNEFDLDSPCCIKHFYQY